MKLTVLGRGGMGRLFGGVLASDDTETCYLGREWQPETLADSDVIVVATPGSSASELADRLSTVPDIGRKLVVCLWSYMGDGEKTLRNLGAPVVYVHLLFGPDITVLAGQNIVIAGEHEHPLFQPMVEMLCAEKARLHFTSPEFHDKIMAYTQSLSQFSSILLGLSLARSGYSRDELRDYASLTFRLNRFTIERIMRQKAALWTELQFENEHYLPQLKGHLQLAAQLADAIEARDETVFTELFEAGADFWRPQEIPKSRPVPKKSDFTPEQPAELTALGPDGTYSSYAAEVYAPEAHLALSGSISEALDMVASGSARQGIVPIENSIQGIVNETIDGLYARELSISQEVIVDVHHALCGLERPEQSAQVQVIYSHPQALAQCRGYLARNYPEARLIPTASTAAGMQLISDQKDLYALAIGPVFAAEKYGLKVLETEIEDEKNNQTKFVVVTRQPEAADLQTTLLAVVPDSDRPGLLHDILAIIKEFGVNLSQLESRPNRQRLGSYMFYMNLDVPAADGRVEQIIGAMEAIQVSVRRMSA